MYGERDAAVFLADHMTRPGADPVGDGKFHLFPTIVTEMYGLTEDLAKGLDGAVDLTLTKFVFRAVLQAAEDLGLEEAELTGKIRRILSAFPEYPTAASGKAVPAPDGAGRETVRFGMVRRKTVTSVDFF